MKYTLLLVLVSLAVQVSVAPPVNQNKKDGEHSDENKIEDKEDMEGIMEYRRYLAEVVETLESDPEFRAKLQDAATNDIHTGKIAEELEFVNHKIRSKLDELKREELERLRHLATKENHLMNGLDFDHLKIAEHIDHTNTRTFEIEDLKKLILKTTKDLAKGDRIRKEKYKEREMKKKYEEQQKLKSMDDNERKKYEEQLRAVKEKHKNHEAVHHPGSKQQLEEVWQVQDEMGDQDFNPKTFFFLHDVDGNGFWDQDEVKALFLKELDKLYAQGAPPDELIKRSEEMERMREHVFNEADLNKDGLISFQEFIEQTKKPDFEQDEGWEGLDEQQIYTPEEFEAFKKHRQEEIQALIAKGMLPAHPGNVPVPHEPFPPQYVNTPVGQGAAPHSQQFQSQHHESYQPQLVVVPQQQYPNQMSAQQMHGQVPQGEYRQQIPHHQMQAQVQQQQYHQAQMPQQHYPDQMKQQQGQVPVQQQQYQVPVQQQQVPAQGQVLMQHGQMPVQSAQIPAQQGQGQPQQGQPQQGQVPVQQHQQPQNVQQSPNQPNTMNEVPKTNAGSRQHNENNLGKQTQQKQQSEPAQQIGINRNNIHTAGKV